MENKKTKSILSVVFDSLSILFLILCLVFIKKMIDTCGAYPFVYDEAAVFYRQLYYICRYLEYFSALAILCVVFLIIYNIKKLIVDIMCLTHGKKEKPKGNVEELEKLLRLKEKGLLTAEEFEERRKQIVSNIL